MSRTTENRGVLAQTDRTQKNVGVDLLHPGTRHVRKLQNILIKKKEKKDNYDEEIEQEEFLCDMREKGRYGLLRSSPVSGMGPIHWRRNRLRSRGGNQRGEGGGGTPLLTVLRGDRRAELPSAIE